MKKGNVFCRKTVLALAFLLQGMMVTAAHAVGVGGSGMYQWSVELRGYVSNETGKAPVAISRLWKAGDKVEVNFGMQLREEATKDDASKVALVYGPVVMAGKLDAVEHPFSDPSKYNDYYTFDFKIPASTVEKAKYDGLKSISKPTPELRFMTKQKVELIPFYDAHHCRYAVYWQK